MATIIVQPGTRNDAGQSRGRMGHDSPMVRLQKVLQHETGEQLMLREHFGTIRTRVEWQHALCRQQRRPRHRRRRFTGACHKPMTHQTELAG